MILWLGGNEFGIRFGGNVFINTPDLVAFEGKSMFGIRRNAEDDTLEVDFDVLNRQGKRVARFRKNIVVQGDAKEFEVDFGHEAYSITEHSSGRVIAQIRRSHVTYGELNVWTEMYLPTGILLRADPNSTSLGTMLMHGNVVSDCRAGINFFADGRASLGSGYIISDSTALPVAMAVPPRF